MINCLYYFVCCSPLRVEKSITMATLLNDSLSPLAKSERRYKGADTPFSVSSTNLNKITVIDPDQILWLHNEVSGQVIALALCIAMNIRGYLCIDV